MKTMILAVAALFAVGCNSSGNGGSGVINMAGTWNFSTSSTRGTTTGTGTLAQSGSSISGTLTLTGACAASAPLSATLSGNNISATLTENGQVVNLTGTVTSDGGSANGTYTSAAGGCTNGDSGTWTATRTSLAGSFIGTLSPADHNPVGLTLVLIENHGTVFGTAMFTNSTCLHTVSVQGDQSASEVQLTGVGSNASVILDLTVGPSGKSLSVTSHVHGSCSGESASGTLFRSR
jgi:hypothetical protein